MIAEASHTTNTTAAMVVAIGPVALTIIGALIAGHLSNPKRKRTEEP